MGALSRVGLCFTYFFLVMSSYYILKPVRESFFIQEQGFQGLPKAHLMVLAATFLAVNAYAELARRVPRRALVLAANIFFVVCIAGFWLVLGPGDAGKAFREKLAWIYFCWVSVFSVFAVTLFWSLTHSLFDPEEGSRYYGWIGSGGILGAMTGGYLTRRLAEIVGTENLLLVSVCILSPCLVIGWVLGSREPVQVEQAEEGSGSEEEEAPTASHGAWELFSGSPYLCVLALIVFLTIFVSILDEYRYQQVIQATYTRQDARTAFYGSIYFFTNILGLFLSLAVTRAVQSRWGPRPGMLLYPLIVLASSVCFLLAPGIEVVFWSAVCIQGVSYSINQFSRELLYLPTTREEKFVAKGFIDTFCFRLGAGVASVFILIAWPEDGVRRISFATIPMAALVAVCVVWITGRYQQLEARRREEASG